MKQQNEVIPIIEFENNLKRQWIDKGIIEGNNNICLLDGNGCHTSLKFYRKCVYDKIHHITPTHLIKHR